MKPILSNYVAGEKQKDFLAKEAASKLRSLLRLVNTERVPMGQNNNFSVMLGKKRIGSMELGRPSSGDLEIGDMILKSEFQGMGLGKKIYGELMRLSDSGYLKSPPRRSDAAKRLWDSIRRRTNAYDVTEHMSSLSRDLPSFRARLNTHVPRTPQGGVRNKPIAMEYDEWQSQYPNASLYD